MRHWGAVLALTFAFGACASAKSSGNEDAGPTASIDAGVSADAQVVNRGATATGSVSGSVKASSPNYKLIGTVNSGTRNSSSTSYKKRGGVVGATQP